MIVKNKKKFVRAILLIIGISIGLVWLMTGQTLSHQELKYKTVAVASGDTLWNIAKIEQEGNCYYDKKDIRDIMQDIKKINNLENSTLKVNQLIKIPTY